MLKALKSLILAFLLSYFLYSLNVLLAMGIISKDKKDILWRGLPTGPYIVGDDESAEESRGGARRSRRKSRGRRRRG